MYITCLDLEGVLVPEIWIAFSKATGIEELKKTTRDEPDYDKLMRYRLKILKEHGLGLKEIQDVIATIDPMEGAKEFLDELRSCCQVIIISDTFTQFAAPLMKKLGMPTIFCNSLRLRHNRGRRQLQRPRHDPREQGRLPVQEHRQDQGGQPRPARVRELRRISCCDKGGNGIKYGTWLYKGEFRK